MNKWIVIISIIGIFTNASTADDNGYDGPYISVTSSDRAYFDRLRRAILSDDADYISKELCGYPFTVDTPAGTIELKSEMDMKKEFGKVFNADMKKVVRGQAADLLFKNSVGLMVGNGEIWFGEIGVTNENKMVWEYRILSIDVPPLKFQKH